MLTPRAAGNHGFDRSVSHAVSSSANSSAATKESSAAGAAAITGAGGLAPGGVALLMGDDVLADTATGMRLPQLGHWISPLGGVWGRMVICAPQPPQFAEATSNAALPPSQGPPLRF